MLGGGAGQLFSLCSLMPPILTRCGDPRLGCSGALRPSSRVGLIPVELGEVPVQVGVVVEAGLRGHPGQVRRPVVAHRVRRSVRWRGRSASAGSPASDSKPTSRVNSVRSCRGLRWTCAARPSIDPAPRCQANHRPGLDQLGPDPFPPPRVAVDPTAEVVLQDRRTGPARTAAPPSGWRTRSASAPSRSGPSDDQRGQAPGPERRTGPGRPADAPTICTPRWRSSGHHVRRGLGADRPAARGCGRVRGSGRARSSSR